MVTQLRQAQAQSPIQVPLLLMTDQEGGLVRRLPGEPVLSAKQIGQSARSGRRRHQRRYRRGTEPRRVGMNVNLAAVLDFYYKPGNFIAQLPRK